MSQRFRAVMLVGVGLAAGLLVGVGMMVGALVAASNFSTAGGGLISLPETALQATATDAGDTLSIATGPIDEDVEGLYTLDFLTGELQALIINPRSGAWSVFKYNVLGDLGAEGKAPKFLMVTGAWSTRSFGSGASRPADSVVYVADAKTGNVGVYSVPWNRSIPPTGKTQEGVLIRVAIGKVRNLVVRE